MATAISEEKIYPKSSLDFSWPELEKEIKSKIFPYPNVPTIVSEVEGIKKILLTAATDVIEETFNYLKEKNCEIRNEIEIRNFLLDHQEIIPYLWGALIKIFEYFGDDQKTALELVFDPEIEKDEGELFLDIITNFEPEEALTQLDKIDEEWFIPTVSQKGLKFNLNLEFI